MIVEETKKIAMPKDAEKVNDNLFQSFVKEVIPYDPKELKYFIHPQRNLFNSKENKFLNSFLSLGKDKRAYFTIKQDEKEDYGYKTYINAISRRWSINTPYYTIYPYISEILLKDILSYEIYKSNSFTFEKQKLKLFKFILNNNILTKSDINQLNNIKLSNKIYLCISRNPIDYIMCSTNQSYSSCMALGSGYSPSGLINLSQDPNRFIMFTTDGKLNKFKLLNGLDEYITHFKYIQRSWVLINEKDRLYAIRSYPSDSMNFGKVLKTLGYDAYDCDLNGYSNFGKSKFLFKIPVLKNGLPDFLYLDNIGINFDVDENKVYYSINGSTGDHFSFNYIRNTIQNLSIDDFYCNVNCNSCHRGINIDNINELEKQKFYIRDSHNIECDECHEGYKHNKCFLCDNICDINDLERAIRQVYKKEIFNIYGYIKEENGKRCIPRSFSEIFSNECELLVEFISDLDKKLCDRCLTNLIHTYLHTSDEEIRNGDFPYSDIDIRDIFYDARYERLFDHDRLIAIREQRNCSNNYPLAEIFINDRERYDTYLDTDNLKYEDGHVPEEQAIAR